MQQVMVGQLVGQLMGQLVGQLVSQLMGQLMGLETKLFMLREVLRPTTIPP
jgi:hypothetical protein